MKKVCILTLLTLALIACGMPKGNTTTNIEKYPFECPGFEYTVYLTKDSFPSYLCIDYYGWDGLNKFNLYVYGANTNMFGDQPIKCIKKNRLIAITHISGTVKEFK